MFKKLGLVFLISTTCFVAGTVNAAKFKEGVDYVVISATVNPSSKIEVTEAFGYLCPHCNSFEPFLQAWEKQQPADVELVRIPVVYGRSWGAFARAYYSSELMDALAKTHAATYSTIHVERQRLRKKEDFVELYSKQGIDKAKFARLLDSFAVNTKLRQGQSKLKDYGVTGVPTMIVNGKYRVLPASHTKQLAVVDYLVDIERTLNKP